MSRKNVVVGRRGAGKTLFCLQFAKQLGLRTVEWLIERADGRTETRQTVVDSVLRLHSNGALQFAPGQQSLLVHATKANRRPFALTDTMGLTEDSIVSSQQRDAIAQTLQTLLSARLILHVMDAAQMGAEVKPSHAVRRVHPLAAMDHAIFLTSQLAERYIVLANKMDLPTAEQGLITIRRALPKAKIVPISARSGFGFAEVERLVWKFA